MQNMFPSRNPLPVVRQAGALLLAGAVLMLAGSILHPAESVDPHVTADSIAAHAGQWAIAHWLLAAGGVLLAVAALRLAQARYGPTRFTSGRRAWLALGLSAVLALEIFVLEATAAVSAGRAHDAAALERLLVPEIPGIVGLFGLSASVVWLFAAQLRDDCPVLPQWANVIAGLGALAGLVGDVGFGLGSDAVATLQYGNGVFLLGLVALAVRALVQSSPSRQAAPVARMG